MDRQSLKSQPGTQTKAVVILAQGHVQSRWQFGLTVTLQLLYTV